MEGGSQPGNHHNHESRKSEKEAQEVCRASNLPASDKKMPGAFQRQWQKGPQGDRETILLKSPDRRHRWWRRQHSLAGGRSGRHQALQWRCLGLEGRQTQTAQEETFQSRRWLDRNVTIVDPGKRRIQDPCSDGEESNIATRESLLERFTCRFCPGS